jgi:hypothetical protein
MESGPARIYGVEIFEVHFGIEAPQWDVAPLSNPATSYAVIRMSDSLYATVYSELGGL